LQRKDQSKYKLFLFPANTKKVSYTTKIWERFEDPTNDDKNYGKKVSK
jgi:hypothetical protein